MSDVDLSKSCPYFSHKAFRADGRCCGCNRMLWGIMGQRRWCDRRNTMLPVCADVDLAFIGDRKNG
jgi:hypothetical protein